MSVDEMRHPLTVHERPAAGPVQAVVFDWGGTLTPWHTIDLGQQWRVFAREVHGIPLESDDVPQEDLDRAQELADRILAVEDQAWRRGRADDRSSAHLDEILREAGLDPREDRHHVALAAYRRFWEPHTRTDPQVRPLWEGLRERGLKVGVLSNTIWSGDYHREIFERDGVLDLIDGDAYSSEIGVVKPHREAFEAVAAQLGVPVTNAVYVGDRLFEDVLGSQEVGMRAIWVPHSDIPADQQVTVDVEPDGVATQLLDVLDIVDGWLEV
ncbi:HAD family hydrolase [Janibacter limosus]|jgi:putative hydrolase of the HAD superfamily|uniref:HAD family hydrolase n=1 Tax=Janibacter limosus TaxID=53458 RepID=A0A4P6MY57_9MICO|nr:HAD family hydrolase [Janibacter limosus]QBF46463.1 HAD family hydrolase [Janibacter limosus]